MFTLASFYSSFNLGKDMPGHAMAIAPAGFGTAVVAVKIAR